MIENLIRTALSTTLAATEVVLSKTLETVRFLNDALEPGEDVRVAYQFLQPAEGASTAQKSTAQKSTAQKSAPRKKSTAQKSTAKRTTAKKTTTTRSRTPKKAAE